MARGQVRVLRNPAARASAHRLIDAAPDGYIAEVRAPRRSDAQNDKMWAMLGDVSCAKPDGRRHTPEVWKTLFMAACGHEVQFVQGLDGNPFPAGFRSSRLTKAEMADLITFIAAWGDEHGVRWTDQENYNG